MDDFRDSLQNVKDLMEVSTEQESCSVHWQTSFNSDVT
jgi:hypothetical protein